MRRRSENFPIVPDDVYENYVLIKVGPDTSDFEIVTQLCRHAAHPVPIAELAEELRRVRPGHDSVYRGELDDILDQIADANQMEWWWPRDGGLYMKRVDPQAVWDDFDITGIDSTARIPISPEGSETTKKRRRGRPVNADVEWRRQTIQQVSKPGLPFPRYCRLLDNVKLETPSAWQREGCPAAYSEAWSVPNKKWQQRIRHERRNNTKHS